MPPVTAARLLGRALVLIVTLAMASTWSVAQTPDPAPNPPASTPPTAPDEPPATTPQETPPEVPNEPAQETPTQETPPEPAPTTDEPDPDDPLAGMDDEDFPPDEPDVIPEEPGAFETWVRLGQLKIRNRTAFYYRRMTSRGFLDLTDLVIPRGTERDHEFRNIVEIETHDLFGEKIHSYLNFDYRQDTDGTREPSFQDSILTSFGDRDLKRLNAAWVEAVDVWGHAAFRLGRQSTVEAHPVTFDGVSAKVDRFRLFTMPAEFRAFGGIMVSEFSNLRQDVVFGGGLTVRPTKNFAFELRDTRYVRNRLEAEARWSISDAFSLTGMYGFYNAKGRDARFEARVVVPGLGLDLTAGHYERYSADFRLDFLTGQSTRRLDRRFLFLPKLAPYRETYLRAEQPLASWFTIGGEFIRHVLRDGGDQSPYDTDFNQLNGFADFLLGPVRLRSAIQYYHANREPYALVVPRFPQPTALVNTRQGERDHIEYHLQGSVNFAPGWNLTSGFVWHRLNYIDSLSEVKHEQFADFRAEISARIRKNVTLRVSYDHARDAEYWNPYFERFQSLSWVLDIRV